MSVELPDNLTRLLTMVAYARRAPEGVPLQELADYLGCSEQEIIEDLDRVLLCGVPPYLPSDYINAGVEAGRVYIMFADHISRPINLTALEAMALLAALRSLPVGVKEQEAVAALRERITGLFSGPGRERLLEADRSIRLGGREPGSGSTLQVIEQAIERGEEVRMEYYTASRNEMSERRLLPYGLVEHGGHWYVVGWCLTRERELPFRVDRIRKIEATGERFETPRNFDLERYTQSEMYFPTARDLRVRIRLAPVLVRWVEDDPPGQEIQRTPDGGAMLQVSVSRAEWLLSWLLQHGGQAEALDPPELRRRMVEHCNATLAAYGES